MVGAHVAGGMRSRRVACMVWVVWVCIGGGTCVAGGMHAGETATEAGGTHPSGMHSCSKRLFKPVTCCVRHQDATTVPERHG